MADVPDTHYATTSDGLRLAFQQWGEGPRLLIVPGLITHTELVWEHELYRLPREHLGEHLTLVEFDKRGIGMSDRFDRLPTLDERLDDIACVMDAVGWDRANLFGISEGGMMSQFFAARFPERVDKVVFLNTFVPTQYRSRLPALLHEGDPPLSEYSDTGAKFARLRDTWSEDPSFMVDLMLPSQAGNLSNERWVGRFQRFSATPTDMWTQYESAIELDAGDAPERITAPSLVMHVKGDRVLPVAGGRLLAELVPGAIYREIEGEDHHAWCMDNWRDLTDAIIEFCTGVRPERVARRQFASVLFTDIVNSTRQSTLAGDAAWREMLDDHDRITRRTTDAHGGRVVKSTGDGVLATFPMPSQGVAAALALLKELAEIGLDIRAGVHAGELEVRDDGDVSGMAVNLAARVEQSARDGELWVSSTVRDMTLGGGVNFVDEGERDLKGIDGRWRLFSTTA